MKSIVNALLVPRLGALLKEHHGGSVLSLSLFNSVQFNMCFIVMTIVSMYCQSIAYSKYIKKNIYIFIYMYSKEITIYNKPINTCMYNYKNSTNQFYEQFKM